MNAAFPPVAPALAQVLRAHLAVCDELLAVVAQEHQALRDAASFNAFEFHQRRKALLPRLESALECLGRHRRPWRALSSLERAQCPEVGALLRANQDLIMKILVLDRENEQTLLRRGLLPARQLPPANRQRPHFVAELYRRHTVR